MGGQELNAELTFRESKGIKTKDSYTEGQEGRQWKGGRTSAGGGWEEKKKNHISIQHRESHAHTHLKDDKGEPTPMQHHRLP